MKRKQYSKYFIAGYYHENYYDLIEDYGVILKDIDVYSIDEIENHPAVEPVREFYHEKTGKDWVLDTTNKIRSEFIEKYTDTDELFFCLGFSNKKQMLKELKDLKKYKKIIDGIING